MDTAPTLNDMMDMSENELEGLIINSRNDDARFVLGMLMVDGTSDKVPSNENKGLTWLKEAAKKNHLAALEYKTYWDIRFSKQPDLKEIIANLEKIVVANKSARAANTLAELHHASASGETATSSPEAVKAAAEKKVLAAKYYMISAD